MLLNRVLPLVGASPCCQSCHNFGIVFLNIPCLLLAKPPQSSEKYKGCQANQALYNYSLESKQESAFYGKEVCERVNRLPTDLEVTKGTIFQQAENWRTKTKQYFTYINVRPSSLVLSSEKKTDMLMIMPAEIFCSLDSLSQSQREQIFYS